jgi:hypothetical protein
MNKCPCLVVRGISDYADTHRNKLLQPYAACVATACGKELLNIMLRQEVVDTLTVADVITHRPTP